MALQEIAKGTKLALSNALFSLIVHIQRGIFYIDILTFS